MSGHPELSHPTDPGPACRESAELMPWLANGSLETSERERLLGHIRECAECRREMARTFEAARIFAQHIPSLALAEYAEGLDPEGLDRAQVEAHLEACPSCQEELALARGSHGRVLDFFPTRRRHTTPPRPSRRWRLVLAASLAAVSLGSFLWSVTSRRLEPADSQPQAVAHTQASLAGEAPGEKADRLFSNGFESGDLPWSDSTQNDPLSNPPGGG